MNKKTRKILEEINKSVPQELRDRLFVETYIAPDLRLEARKQAKELFEEAEALPEGSEKKAALKTAQRLQNIIDAGYYDEKELRVDMEVAKQIEAYIDAEIDKAIKDGRIPHPDNDRDYDRFIRKLNRHEHNRKPGGEPAAGVAVPGAETEPDHQA